MRLDVKACESCRVYRWFDAEKAQILVILILLLGRLFGEDEARNTEKGHIQIDLGKAKLAEWLPVINAFVGQEKYLKPASSSTIFPMKVYFPPWRVSIPILAASTFRAQQLTERRLNAKPNETGWRFNTVANEFDGWVDFYPNWRTQGLKVVASKFYFHLRLSRIPMPILPAIGS